MLSLKHDNARNKLFFNIRILIINNELVESVNNGPVALVSRRQIIVILSVNFKQILLIEPTCTVCGQGANP